MATVGEAQVKIVADARGFARDVERQVNRALRDVDSSGGVRAFGRRVNQQVTRETNGGFRLAAANALTQFGIVLQGGISRSAAGAFGVAVLAALLPVMLFVGTAAAGVLILAFGGGIAAIGIIAAAQSKKVQKVFSDMASNVGDTLRDIAKPFEPALVEIAGIVEDTFNAFAPTLGEAFEQLAPAIVDFTRALSDAFIALEPAIIPIIDAFIALLEELGPQLADEVFPDLAESLKDLAETVEENADSISDLIGWFLQAVEATVDFITWLTELSGWFADNPAAIAAALGIMTVAFAAFGIAVTGGVGLIVLAIVALGLLFINFKEDIARIWFQVVGFFQDGVDKARELLGRLGRFIGQAVDGFVDNFNSLKENFRNVVESIGRFVSNMGRTIRDGFNSVVSFVKSIPGRIADAASGMWDSIVSTFKDAINGIIGAWNNLSFTIPAISAFGKTLGGSTIGTPNIPFLQDGGIIQRSGAAIVGEAGPEAVFLQRGAVVQPLPDDGGGGDGLPAEFEATAVIDLGRGVQEVIRLTFADVRRGANAGVGGAR